MLQLSDCETEFLEAVIAAKAYDPSNLLVQPELMRHAPLPGSRFQIRADLIKELLISPERLAGLIHHVSKIQVVGVEIIGPLNLSDLSGQGSTALPSLLMQYCRFDAVIDISGSHFNSLSLRGARCATIEGEGAQIDSSLDLREIASSAKDEGERHSDTLDTSTETQRHIDYGRWPEPSVGPLCSVNLRASRIDGSLELSNAELCGAPPLGPYLAGRRPFGLNLKGAEIKGDVVLQPDVRIQGGISLAEARVDQSVWACGLKISCAVGQNAIDLDSATIGQHFQLRGVQKEEDVFQQFVVIGQISLLSTSIGGELRLAGGTIYSSFRSDRNSRKDALSVSPVIQVWMGKIARIHIGSEGSEKLFIEGDVRVYNTHVYHDVSIDNLFLQSIERDEIEPGKLPISPLKSDEISYVCDIYFRSVKVGGSLVIGSVDAGVRISGSLVLQNSFIEGDAIISNVELLRPQASSLPQFSLEGSEVSGKALIDCTCAGVFIASRARFSGDLDLRLSLFWRAGYTPERILDFTDVEVKHRFNVERFDLQHELNDTPSADLPNVDNVISSPLIAFPGWRLVQGTVGREEEFSKLVSYLAPPNARPQEFILLDGTAAAIYQMIMRFQFDREKDLAASGGKRSAVMITSPEAAREYLVLFCEYVWGPGGPFHVITNINEVSSISDQHITHIVRDNLGVINPEPTPFGFDIKNVLVVYAGDLFQSNFKMYSSGQIEMFDDMWLADVSRWFQSKTIKPIRLVWTDAQNREKSSVKLIPDFHYELGDDVLVKKVSQAWQWSLQKSLKPGRPFTISLRGGNFGSLNDRHGSVWSSGWDHIANSLRARSWRDRCREVLLPNTQLDLERLDNRRESVTLILDGLRYGSLERIESERSTSSGASSKFNDVNAINGPENVARSRVNWLMLQYSDLFGNLKTLDFARYNPQPFEEMAKALVSQGDYGAARHVYEARWNVYHIIRMRSWLSRLNDRVGSVQTVKGALLGRALSVSSSFGARFAIAIYSLFPLAYGRCFQYGMSAPRAVATFVLCILLGWGGTWVADTLGQTNGDPILVVESQAVALAVENGSPRHLGLLGVSMNNQSGVLPFSSNFDDVACAGSISPFLYALDVFIPLLDLRQESVCRVSDHHWGWVWVKAMYALLGWLVTSLCILTISGTVQRRIDM